MKPKSKKTLRKQPTVRRSTRRKGESTMAWLRRCNPDRYTHRDAAGMPWRFAGGRPVSALADQVMAECGLPLP